PFLLVRGDSRLDRARTTSSLRDRVRLGSRSSDIFGRRQEVAAILERAVQARCVHARARTDERKRYRAGQRQRVVPWPGRSRQVGQYKNHDGKALSHRRDKEGGE